MKHPTEVLVLAVPLDSFVSAEARPRPARMNKVEYPCNVFRRLRVAPLPQKPWLRVNDDDDENRRQLRVPLMGGIALISSSPRVWSSWFG
jgi:hypothetical protein